MPPEFPSWPVGGLLIDCFIEGIPYAQNKVRGDLEAPERWTQAIMEKCRQMPAVKGPCLLEVEFVLPTNKFPKDLPFGMDLDNLLKRLLDALGETVFRGIPGKDSAIVDLRASKRPVRNGEASGARVVIREYVSGTPP